MAGALMSTDEARELTRWHTRIKVHALSSYKFYTLLLSAAMLVAIVMLDGRLLDNLMIGYTVVVGVMFIAYRRYVVAKDDEVERFRAIYYDAEWEELIDFAIKGYPYERIVRRLVFSMAPDNTVAALWRVLAESLSHEARYELSRELVSHRKHKGNSMSNLLNNALPELARHLPVAIVNEFTKK